MGERIEGNTVGWGITREWGEWDKFSESILMAGKTNFFISVCISWEKLDIHGVHILIFLLYPLKTTENISALTVISVSATRGSWCVPRVGVHLETETPPSLVCHVTARGPTAPCVETMERPTPTTVWPSGKNLNIQNSYPWQHFTKERMTKS